MGLKQSLQIFTQVPNARGTYCCLADHSLSPCSLLSFCLCVFIKGLLHNTLLVMKTTCWHLKPFNIHMTLSIQRSTLDHISSIVWVCKQVSVTVSAGKKHGWPCECVIVCYCALREVRGVGECGDYPDEPLGFLLKNTTLLWQKPLKDHVRPKWSQEGRISISSESPSIRLRAPSLPLCLWRGLLRREEFHNPQYHCQKRFKCVCRCNFTYSWFIVI